MKKKINKLICIIILIFILLSNILIMYDSHVSKCTHLNCKQCLIIYNIKEMIKCICIMYFLLLFLVSLKMLNNFIKIFTYNIYKNLVMLKVKLNE